MRFSKLWMIVLAVTLALYGLFILDVLDSSSIFDIIGIGMIASAVLLILDR